MKVASIAGLGFIIASVLLRLCRFSRIGRFRGQQRRVELCLFPAGAETGGLNCRSWDPRMIQNFSASSFLAAAHATCIRKACCHGDVKSLSHLYHIPALIVSWLRGIGSRSDDLPTTFAGLFGQAIKGSLCRSLSEARLVRDLAP